MYVTAGGGMSREEVEAHVTRGQTSDSLRPACNPIQCSSNNAMNVLAPVQAESFFSNNEWRRKRSGEVGM
jgi:hypothetical protein